MMKILGDKIIRDSKVFVVKIGKHVLKIPLSRFACEEMREERAILQGVEKDSHFSKYLFKYKYFFNIQSSLYFIPLSELKKKDDIINGYFNHSFNEFDKWKEIELKKIIESDYFLDFIKKYFEADYELWGAFINSVKMPLASSHGDFYPDNILVSENGRIFFIDWVRYNNSSSRYFDLFDYYIFSSKEKYAPISWIKFWKNEYESGIKNLLGINIKREYFLSYGIWKMSKEIKMLEKRKKMTEQKIKKYSSFVKYLLKIIYENQLHYSHSQQK